MEMYKSKLAVAIKHNGKILRENKDLVQLPFGSEFSVLVKNLNSRRVKFTLHIDGQDVLDGTEIIVNANSEIELKRFIRNGNMNEGNAFKFIERTQAIEDGPRGIKIDDGTIRVEFWFEQEKPEVKTVIHKDIWWDEYRYPYRRTYWSPFYRSLNGTSASDIQNVKPWSNSTAASKGVMRGMSTNASIENSSTTDSFVPQEAGITVPGSKVEQTFTTVYGFVAENVSNVIIIRLVGKVGNLEVTTPLTVKTKNKCVTCGYVNKYNAKFCSQCATSLELV